MSAGVWGYFYGGLINPAVMARVGLKPTAQELGTLSGFDLRIAPYVNLVPEPDGLVFGLLMRTTHSELTHVYSQLKAVYNPVAVLVMNSEGRFRPALCYIVEEMAPAQADAEHVEVLACAGEQLGFPSWYLEKVRSFLPK